MPTIIIKRKTDYVNSFRSYQLILDGKKVGTIKNGETKELETTTGQHCIQAKIDWYTSPELVITLNEVDKKELTVAEFKNSWLLIVGFAVAGLSKYLINAFHFVPLYGIFFILPLLLISLYYLTLGRKKYISIKEG